MTDQPADGGQYDAPFLIKLRRELYADTQRRLERAPEMAPTIQAEWEADDKVLADALTDHLHEMESLVYWSSKRDEDPIAADLMGVLLEARSDSDVWDVARDISSRFHAVAQPAPEPEPSELVAPVDANSPFSGFRDAAARPRVVVGPPDFVPRDPDRPPIVNSSPLAPLGELSTRHAGFIPRVVRETFPPPDFKQAMRQEGLLKPGGRRR